MSEAELLPLPKWCYADKHLHVGSAAIRKEMRAYARANVAHATEPLKAEIEALRGEVAEWKRVASAQAELHGEAEARAERMAETLRRAEGLLRSAGIIAESDLERPHSAATEIKNALRDHDQEGN